MQRLIVTLNGLRTGDQLVGIQLDGPTGALVPVPDFIVEHVNDGAIQFDTPMNSHTSAELEAAFREAVSDTTTFHIVRTAPDMTPIGDLGPISPPDGRLHLLLIAAAFEHLSHTAVEDSTQPSVADVGASMSQWLEMELLDPTRTPTAAGIQSVTMLALAYTKAADQVRAINTDGTPLHDDGIGQAAAWLDTQAHTFATLAARLANIDHPKEPNHRI